MLIWNINKHIIKKLASFAKEKKKTKKKVKEEVEEESEETSEDEEETSKKEKEWKWVHSNT